MAVLPNISIVTPTLGGSSGQWDDLLNSALALIDAHDHSSGKGVAINSDAITIDANLSIAGYALTSVGKVAFSAITAPVSGAVTLFVNTSDNELYWRTNAGTNVKLTSGTTLNVSLIGGIAGDYTSVSAQVAFDDANDRYTFKQNSATGWARLASGEVRIYETGTSESVYVGHAAAAALAASYTVTWPAALPGSTALVQVSSTGIVSFSNTVASAITATDYKISSDRTLILSGAAFIQTGTGGGAHSFSTGTGGYWTLGNSATIGLAAHIPLCVGDRVKSCRVRTTKLSDNTNTLTVDLIEIDGAGVVGTESRTTTGALAYQGPTGLTTTVAATKALYVLVTQTDATPSTGDLVGAIEIVYDRP